MSVAKGSIDNALMQVIVVLHDSSLIYLLTYIYTNNLFLNFTHVYRGET